MKNFKNKIYLYSIISEDKEKVEKFLNPEEFAEFSSIGEKMGFEYVASGPLVRSSYKAAEFYIENKIRKW